MTPVAVVLTPEEWAAGVESGKYHEVDMDRIAELIAIIKAGQKVVAGDKEELARRGWKIRTKARMQQVGRELKEAVLAFKQEMGEA